MGCAVAEQVDIGFDLEQVRNPAPLDVAARYFNAPELAGLRALGAAEQSDRFYALWTLKEAYLKARGLGLSLALQKFAVDPAENGQATLLVQPEDDPGPWALRHWRLGDHRLALALRTELACEPVVSHEQRLER